jgi:hypothetical protein
MIEADVWEIDIIDAHLAQIVGCRGPGPSFTDKEFCTVLTLVLIVYYDSVANSRLR